MTSPTARANVTLRRPPPVLAIASPIYGGVHPSFTEALIGTHAVLSQHGIPVQWFYLAGDSMISRARNDLSAICLAQSVVTHILWVDADIAWYPEDVLRLLAHDVDFVAGFCPIKTLPDGSVVQFNFHPLVGDDGSVPFDRDTGLIEAEFVGTGFMLTSRTVYERMIAAYPEAKLRHSLAGIEKRPEVMRQLHNFFPVEVVDGGLLGEDDGFCRRWRAIGGQIWGDPGIQIIHHKAHALRCDPMSMFVHGPVAADPVRMSGAA